MAPANLHLPVIRPEYLTGASLAAALELITAAAEAGSRAEEWSVPALATLVAATVQLVRTGSLEELTEGAELLRSSADGAAGSWLAAAEPEAPARIRTLAATLTVAAGRRDAAAVESLLRRQRGRGHCALALLADAGDHGLTQRELGVALAAVEPGRATVAEASLSRLLEPMEQAGLIVRTSDGTAKRVVATAAGRARVGQTAGEPGQGATAQRAPTGRKPAPWENAAFVAFPGTRVAEVREHGVVILLRVAG